MDLLFVGNSGNPSLLLGLHKASGTFRIGRRMQSPNADSLSPVRDAVCFEDAAGEFISQQVFKSWMQALRYITVAHIYLTQCVQLALSKGLSVWQDIFPGKTR